MKIKYENPIGFYLHFCHRLGWRHNLKEVHHFLFWWCIHYRTQLYMEHKERVKANKGEPYEIPYWLLVIKILGLTFIWQFKLSCPIKHPGVKMELENGEWVRHEYY